MIAEQDYISMLNHIIGLLEDAQDGIDDLLSPKGKLEGADWTIAWVAYNLIRDQIHELMRINPEHDKAHCWECQDLREKGVQP